MSILIKMKYLSNLTSSEKIISEYVLRNPNEILRMTTREIGEVTYTSASTVTRFFKKIDPDGLLGVKLKLAKELESYTNLLSTELSNESVVKKEDDLSEVINKISEVSKLSIEETEHLLDEVSITKCVQLINDAHVIDCYGIGASNLVALDASHKFMRAGKVVQCHQLHDRQIVQASNSNNEHVAIIVSYSGETKEIINLAKKISDNLCPIIVITGKVNSTLTNFADVSLFASSRETELRAGAMSSRLAQLFIVDILYNCYLHYDYEKRYVKVYETIVHHN